jgi:hypothetical protein
VTITQEQRVNEKVGHILFEWSGDQRIRFLNANDPVWKPRLPILGPNS